MGQIKIIITLSIALLFTYQAQAQFYVGGVSGVFHNGVAAKNASGKMKGNASAMYGFKLSSVMSKKWMFEAELFRRELQYVHTTNMDIVNPNGSGYIYVPTKISYEFSYLTTTLKFTYMEGDKFKFIRGFGLGLGLKDGFNASSPDMDSPVTNFAEKIDENLIQPGLMNVFLLANAGVSYTTGRFLFTLEGRVNYSLSDHDVNVNFGTRKLRHRSIAAVFGVGFKLGGRKRENTIPF